MQCISVSKLPEVPIGTILSWVPEVDHNGGEFASLPDGWIRCDGSKIPSANGSIWAGKMVPDLNGERRFLRGGSDNDVLTMEEAQMESHDHSVSASAHVYDPGHSHSYQYESGHLWEGDNANDRDMITSMDWNICRYICRCWKCSWSLEWERDQTQKHECNLHYASLVKNSNIGRI